jgi:hypothetical protein
MIGLTFYPFLISNRIYFYQTGLMLPVLYIVEFVFIFPLYVFYFRKFNGLGRGVICSRHFVIFLFLIIIAQYAGAYILNIRKEEGWIVDQESIKGVTFWMNILLLIFVVPIYEEIIFRGCLLNAFIILFKGNIYFSSFLTSVIFALLHTQYTDIRTFFILFMVSLILIGARVTSRGLMMPISLHIAMNGIVIGISYAINF